MTNIGSNIFENCSIPIIFIDRYFALESINAEDLFTVFIAYQGKLIFEIIKNEPQENPLTIVSKNPTGIITVGAKETDDFIYKVRPEYKGSSIFGKINGEEKEMKITDKNINYAGNIFSCNIFDGTPVGIKINSDGSFGMGGGIPPEIKNLFK